MAHVKSGVKNLFIVGVVVVVLFGLRFAALHGYINAPGISKALSVQKVDLPSQNDAQVANVAPLPYPSTSEASVSATPIRFDVWEWNAMSALMLANGGKHTTKGSLMEKYGVNLYLKREDSNNQMKSDLVACANQLHDGSTSCTQGAEAIIVMGDGAGQWLADLNPQLKKLGDDYKLVIIGAVGRSNGEDALLGPPEWKRDPQTLKGKTIVGVLRDGDWNIALKFLGDNNLKNNPDVTTYDPDAVNWIAAPDEDYIKAVTEVFIPNRCDERRVVKDGRLTGDKVNVCPDGVVTWTPGDQQAVDGRSGTVKIVSSRDYSAQMPAVIIGIKHFFRANADEFQGLLAANFQAADQIKAYDAALKKSAEISFEVYNKDQSPEYWYKYFKGVSQKGTLLGGSAVFNLEDDLNYFGLTKGYNNNMATTYTTFANIATTQYKDLFSKNPIPPYREAVDTSYILGAQSLLNSSGVTGAEAETTDYSKQVESGSMVSHAAYHIEFATGSDQPLPSSIPELERIKSSLAIASGLAVKIDGFTDNVGNPASNQSLSERRAYAVKRYLQERAPRDFPDSRFQSVKGHGQSQPIASNDTADGKARNRRVEITQIGD
jgi:OOP family OmpA-OmpF porin